MFCLRQAGYYNDYVPAGGGPSRGALADTNTNTNSLPKRKTGMENSMWAPKNAKLSVFTSRGY